MKTPARFAVFVFFFAVSTVLFSGCLRSQFKDLRIRYEIVREVGRHDLMGLRLAEAYDLGETWEDIEYDHLEPEHAPFVTVVLSDIGEHEAALKVGDQYLEYAKENPDEYDPTVAFGYAASALSLAEYGKYEKLKDYVKDILQQSTIDAESKEALEHETSSMFALMDTLEAYEKADHAAANSMLDDLQTTKSAGNLTGGEGAAIVPRNWLYTKAQLAAILGRADVLESLEEEYYAPEDADIQGRYFVYGSPIIAPLMLTLGADEGFRMFSLVVRSRERVRNGVVMDNSYLFGMKAYFQEEWESAIENLEVYISFTKPSTAPTHRRRMAYTALGASYEAAGNTEKALENYLLAIADLEIMRRDRTKDSYKRSFMRGKSEPYERAVRLLILRGKPEEAFQIAEMEKARSFADLMEGREKAALDFVTAGEGAEEGQVLGGSVSPSVAKLLTKEHAQELATSLDAPIQGWAEIEQILGGRAFVQYYTTDSYSAVFWSSGSGLQGRLLDLTGAELTDLVMDFRQAIESRDINVPEYSRTVSEKILPRESYNAGSVLTIIPDGVLHLLPFAALHTDDAWLVQATAIQIYPSSNSIRYFEENQQVPTTLVALGNPRTEYAQPLPGAEAEVEAIARRFPQGSARIFTGSAATEEVVYSSDQPRGILHLASHGMVNANSPSSSAMLLTPSVGSDGLLQVGEIALSDLNYGIVVLSACETGLGALTPGDDVVGLTRAFQLSGANSVLASLWRVDDEATNRMMVDFHGNLLNGQTVGQALNAAQIGLLGGAIDNHPSEQLNSPDRAIGPMKVPKSDQPSEPTKEEQTRSPLSSEYAHPYFWAGIQLYGSQSSQLAISSN